MTTQTPNLQGAILPGAQFSPTLGYRPNFMRIVSIFPVDKFHRLMLTVNVDGVLRSGEKQFFLPKAERGSHTYIDVFDDWKYIPDFDGMGPMRTSPGLKPVPMPAQQIASSLVNLWALDIPGGISGTPGIGALPPNQEEITKAFIDELTERQEIMAQSLVTKANDLHTKGESKNINELHRVMLEWLYGYANACKYKWFEKPKVTPTKKCLGCQKDIEYAVTVCEFCRLDLVARYLGFGYIPEEDPIVAAEVRKIMAAQAAKQSGPVQPPTSVPVQQGGKSK